MTITIFLWDRKMTEGFPMTLLTGLTALRHLLGEEEHLGHLDNNTAAHSGLHRNDLTIATFHGGLLVNNDALAGREADHRIFEGPPDVTEQHPGTS